MAIIFSIHAEVCQKSNLVITDSIDIKQLNRLLCESLKKEEKKQFIELSRLFYKFKMLKVRQIENCMRSIHTSTICCMFHKEKKK